MLLLWVNLADATLLMVFLLVCCYFLILHKVFAALVSYRKTKKQIKQLKKELQDLKKD